MFILLEETWLDFKSSLSKVISKYYEESIQTSLLSIQIDEYKTGNNASHSSGKSYLSDSCSIRTTFIWKWLQSQMNVRHCCQMVQLVAEEIGFGQGCSSPSHTTASKYPREKDLNLSTNYDHRHYRA